MFAECSRAKITRIFQLFWPILTSWRVSEFTGLEWWNGMVEWTGMVEWNGGMEWKGGGCLLSGHGPLKAAPLRFPCHRPSPLAPLLYNTTAPNNV